MINYKEIHTLQSVLKQCSVEYWNNNAPSSSEPDFDFGGEVWSIFTSRKTSHLDFLSFLIPIIRSADVKVCTKDIFFGVEQIYLHTDAHNIKDRLYFIDTWYRLFHRRFYNYSSLPNCRRPLNKRRRVHNPENQ